MSLAVCSVQEELQDGLGLAIGCDDCLLGIVVLAVGLVDEADTVVAPSCFFFLRCVPLAAAFPGEVAATLVSDGCSVTVTPSVFFLLFLAFLHFILTLFVVFPCSLHVSFEFGTNFVK